MKNRRILFAMVFLFIFIWNYKVEARVPQPTRETTLTKDKVQLVFRRYKRKGAQPVLLVHGLAQNCFHWDLPLPNRSFAKYLYKNGYDVWIANLRSHGKGNFKSETPKKSWSVDDFAIYDVPALVNKINHATGKKPYYIGFSMGGMVAYMYLQGIYHHPKTGRVVSNLQLALERNTKIKGLITIGSPVTMAWKYRPTLDKMANPKSYYDYNYILDALPGRKATMYSFLFMRKVPLQSLIKVLFPSEKWGKVRSKRGWMHFWGERFPFNYVWHAPNMSPKTMEALLDQSVDNINGKVLAQFTHWCIKRTFSEYNIHNNKKNPYIYADHMYKIILPFYMIGGDKDKLVCDDILQEKGFTQISSPDKTFRSFSGFGHLDLCVGLNAPTKVYPSILKWLKDQSQKELLSDE